MLDGAIGTVLLSLGVTSGSFLPALNLTRPGLVSSVHRAYLDAGADVIEANTFGANRVTMRHFEDSNEPASINAAAVGLAREAADSTDRRVLVAGSIAPAAPPRRDGESLDQATLEALVEQVDHLGAVGVDLLVFETFGDLVALAAVIEAANASVPILAHLTFGHDGRTIGGQSPQEVGRVLGELGVEAIGANCLLGPGAMLAVLSALGEASELPLSVQPTATESESSYGAAAGEAQFATVTARAIELGAAYVGGCCGTTPRHIEALVKALESNDPVSPLTPVVYDR